MDSEFWRERRVLVTGHTGFKGAWLCMLLHRLGARISGFALEPPTHPSLYELAGVDALVHSTLGDVRDLSHLTRTLADAAPQVLIHMAAQSVVLTSYEDPVETYATNVMGTVNVLEAVRRLGRPVTVVNVTTDKAYLNQGWVWSYRENDALGGRDPYSNSKACSELVAQAFRHSFFPTDDFARHGVALASARAGNVIGGGDWTAHQLVPDLIEAYGAGRPVELRSPDAIRPWQHVLDCLRGYLTLAQRAATTPLQHAGEWNFGPSADEVLTVAQVADLLAPHWNVSPAWTPAAGPQLHEELELRLDSSKARRRLGWQCLLSTARALDWVAQWYRRTQAGESARAVSDDQIRAFLALAPRSGA